VILENIKSYFGVGQIYEQDSLADVFKVQSVKDLKVIIDHFDKYPLITQKRGDYLIFKEVIGMVAKKEHLTREGLDKIVALKASLNKGLPDKLKAAFPNVVSINRPLVKLPLSINPYWLAGFIEAEGCFNINLLKSKTHIIGTQVNVRFILTQHLRDLELMRIIAQFLGYGILSEDKRKPIIYLTVTKISDITKVVSFLTEFPLLGSKKLDFTDFCKVVELMKNKEHLTTEGLDRIRLIKDGMNTKRVIYI
jgi:hypothetical protein